jgi:hypothetical protein
MKTSFRQFCKLLRENYKYDHSFKWNPRLRNFYRSQYDLFASGVRDGRLHDNTIILIDLERSF